MWKPLWEIRPLLNRLWMCKVVRVSSECRSSHPGICRRVNSLLFTFVTKANVNDLGKVMELQVYWASCCAAEIRPSELRAFAPRGTGLGQAPGVWNVSDYSIARHKQVQSQRLQVERQKEHKVPLWGVKFLFVSPRACPSTGDQLLCATVAPSKVLKPFA